jgi:hypothetical protein
LKGKEMKTTKILTILILLPGLIVYQAEVKGAIDGSGTANHIPKFTGADTIGDSVIYDAFGNVCMGTTSPEKAYRLTVDGAGSLYGIFVRNTGDVGIESIGANYGLRGSGNSRGISGISTNGFGVFGETTSGYAGYFKGGQNYFEGNVGIGTIKPGAKLEVNGQVKITGGSPGAGKVLMSDNSGLASWQKPVAGSDSDWIISGNDMYSAVSGKVGIGTSSPSEKLEVRDSKSGNNVVCAGQYFAVKGTHNSSGNYGTLGSSYSGAFARHNKSGNVVYLARSDCALDAKGVSGTGIMASGKSHAAVFDGNVLVRTWNGILLIELGEGLDYAEGFDVSQNKEISPGSVLVIDPDNIGKLMLSNKSYDSKVAGIVGGAKGQGSGVRLGAGQFDYDVALAGRVYCNVDATETAVQPGDLLTTSDTEGYAMRAIDYSRAQGAILGKAMEKLEKGNKGQILVLVTLQ